MMYFYKMFRFMRPYAVRYAISQIIYSSQGFAFPFVLSVFAGNIMAAVANGDRDAVFRSGIVLAVMLGAFIVVFLVGVYVNIVTIEQAAMDMKRELFRKFVRTGLEDASHSGEGIAAINTDANTASGVFEGPLMQLMYSIIAIIGATVVVFSADWKLGFAVVVVGVVSFFMQHRFTEPLARVGKEQLEANADSLKAVSNAFSGAMAIRAYNMQPQAFLTFDKENLRMKKLDIRRGLIRMGQRLFGTVEGWLTLAVVFGFGGWLVAMGQIEFHSLASVYIMAATLTNAIGSLGANYAGLQPPIEGAKRIFAILDREEAHKSGNFAILDRREPHETKTVQKTKTIQNTPALLNADSYHLSIDNFTFQYRDAASPALKDISLEIPENRMVAFVGASGSGKSTLLKAIVGMYERDDLNISVGGKAFADTPIEEWRKFFAYVDQSGKLFDMTIRENIALGCADASDDDVIAAAKQAAIHDFIETLENGYSTPCGEKGASLSGGQRQRIAIARALIKKAPVLVFDEATSALDAETEGQIMETIHALRKDYTILIATHNLESAKAADTVITLVNGSILSPKKDE
ncbi:MAG: ABC transporter ATP-binding protein/permease [Defluviitaleaceae bacterium]|nr:ABC transporter ATP-binding protein/permease [Defluviitaleaceae bacterium]